MWLKFWNDIRRFIMDKKEYLVDVDVTISIRMYVTAQNEQEAEKKAKMEIILDPMYHAYHRGHYVGMEVVEVYEEE